MLRYIHGAFRMWIVPPFVLSPEKSSLCPLWETQSLFSKIIPAVCSGWPEEMFSVSLSLMFIGFHFKSELVRIFQPRQHELWEDTLIQLKGVFFWNNYDPKPPAGVGTSVHWTGSSAGVHVTVHVIYVTGDVCLCVSVKTYYHVCVNEDWESVMLEWYECDSCHVWSAFTTGTGSKWGDNLRTGQHEHIQSAFWTGRGTKSCFCL